MQHEEYKHNIWTIHNDHIIENDGSVILGIEIYNGDISCLSDQSLNNIGISFAHLIESFNEDSEVYVLNNLEGNSAYEELINDYLGYDQSQSKVFSSSKVESINNHNLLKTKTYVLIRKKINSPSLDKYYVVLDEAKRERENAINCFKGTIFKTRNLDDEDIYNLYYQHLNNSKKRTIPTSPDLELLDNNVEVGKSFIRVGDKLRRSISLFKLPAVTEPGMCADIVNGAFLNLPFQFSCSVKIDILNQKDVISNLKSKSIRKSFLANLATRKNYDAEAGLQDIDELLTDIAKSGTKLVDYSMNINIEDTTLEGLEYKTDQILSALSNLEEGSKGIIEEYDQFNLFLNHLPGLSNENIRSHLITSKNAADLLPIYMNWEGTSKPKQIFFNRNHGLLPLDPFDDSLQAYNAIIFGSTGSGKSFAANYLLQSFLSQNKNVTIVDIGGSYKKLVNLFDGDYFEINHSVSLNPFYDPVDLEIEKDIKLGVLSTIIESMVAEEKGCDPAEKAIIDEAITQLYLNSKSTPKISDYEIELVKLKASDKFTNEKIDGLIESLQIWTRGRYSKMINQRESIYSNKQIVAFDLKGLDKRLQSVVLNILSGLIWNRITHTSGEKIVLFDEVWSLFKSDSSSLMIEELYRTARKYHAGVYAISQSLEDFTESKIASAIMNNSILRFCLKLKDKPEVIKKYLGLNDHEIGQIQMLKSVKGQYSEVFLCFSDQHCVTKIIPSPLEYWVCTTSKKDLDKEDRYRVLYPKVPYLKRLQRIAKEYPNGC